MGQQHGGAIVVSGATRGVGRSTATAFAQAGFRVYAGVLPGEREAWTPDGPTAPGAVEAVDLDVTQPTQIAALARKLDADGLPLRAVVNVAGVARFDVQELADPAMIRRMFDVNVFGGRDLAVACVPLLKRSRGRIVFVSSMAAKMAMPFLGGYAATKTAIEFFADALRMELRPWGVTVACVEPGGIKSDMTTEALHHLQARAQECTASDDLRPYAGGYQAMADSVGKDIGKFLSTQDVAAALVGLVTAPSMPIRTVLGKDAKAVVMLRRLLPDGLLDKVLSKQVKLSRAPVPSV